MSDTNAAKLLFVEDDADFCASLVPRLEKRGFAVETASSAEEGIKKVVAEEFHAVIADIKLPEMSGIEFLARIRDFDERLPVILLTGYGNLETAQEAVKLNAQDYLLKPLESIDDLLAPVKRAIRIHDLEAENKRLQEEITESSEQERRRLGRDLHDGLCQDLTGISMISKDLEKRLRKKSAKEAASAEKISDLIGKATEQARSIAAGLCPVRLQTEGFTAALADLASDCSRIFDIDCSLRCPEELPIKNEYLATHLYRIVQESISNAVRHGDAEKVVISVTEIGDEAVISVTDDGKGATAVMEGSGMGSHIMKYRADLIGASLKTRRMDEGGSVLTCTTPTALEKQK